jgi:ABC-type Fe3+/spermidine/putrescine transport system ATPase subunit
VDGGELFHETPLPANIQTTAVLAIRPENLFPEKLTTPGTGILEGKIERATYMGNMTDYLVKVGPHELRAQISGFCDLHTGDRVQLTIKASSVFAG